MEEKEPIPFAVIKPRRFEVYFGTSAYDFALLDEHGREQFNVDQAAALAERMYGTGRPSGIWRKVSNGDVTMTRDDWLSFTKSHGTA